MWMKEEIQHCVRADDRDGRMFAAANHVVLGVRFVAERAWERFREAMRTALNGLGAVIDPVID